MCSIMKQVWKYSTFTLLILALQATIPCLKAETINSYGNEYIAITNYRPGEHCIITALFEPTTVTLSNGQQFTLHRGEKHLIPAEQWMKPDGTRSRTLYIHASEPVHVLHTTSFGDTYVTTELPSLSCETPQKQHYTFTQKNIRPSLFLITPANQTQGFEIDGKVLKMDDSNPVSGNDDWTYTVVDLGTRKANSTITVSGPTNRFHAAIVGNNYEYLADCALEASVTIDTIYGARISNIHTDENANELYTAHMYSYDEYTDDYDSLYLSDYDKNEEDKPSHNRVTLYLQGAYAALPILLPESRIGLGYGATAGVLYEYQYHSFLMQMGAGFYWLDMRNDIMDQPVKNRHDRTIFGGIEIPLLFGQNFDIMYYLLGVKMGFNLISKTQMICEPNNPTINRIMPQVLRESNASNILLDPRAHVEFGFNLGHERNTWVKSRLGLFADYGFYPEHTTSIGEVPPSTEVGDPLDYATYNMTHILDIAGNKGQYLIHHIQVGLKFSLVLGN